MASADARLAVLGEAFLNSIDRREPAQPRTKKRAASTSPKLSPAGSPGLRPASGAAPTTVAATGAAARKRRRKERRAAAAVGGAVGDARAGTGGTTRVPDVAGDAATASEATAPRLVDSAAPTVEVQPAPAKAAKAAPKISAAERRRFMSGKVADIRSKGQPPPQRRGGRGSADDDIENDREFKKTLREVLDFVTPQLGKHERRQYEESKIRALGGTLEKRQKMPFKKEQADRKQGELTRQKKLAEEKTLGVSMSVNKHRRQWAVDRLQRVKQDELKAKKRRRDEGGFMRLGLGAHEKRGMAVIPNRALKRFQQ